MFTKFLPTWTMSRLERGWYQTTNITKGLPYSPVNLTPMGSIHTSTIGALVGGNPKPLTRLGYFSTTQLEAPNNKATKGYNATKGQQSHKRLKDHKRSTNQPHNRLGFQDTQE